MSVQETNQLINSGHILVIAGEEEVLNKLNTGDWIGGTIPYFMNGESGGVVDQEQVFVTDFTAVVAQAKIQVYNEEQITKTMLEDRFKDGFSYVLLPAFSSIHQTYALKTGEEPTLFDVPTMGWITGVHLDDIGTKTPKVINGKTGEVLSDKGCVLHCQLPTDKYGELSIVNIYEQGLGDKITFKEDDFSCSDCWINGEPANLADYYVKNEIDVSLPLVADYSGASINVSIQSVDAETGKVAFFAPVLNTREYHIAKPIDDLYAAFCGDLPEDTSGVVCSCNCVLNYVNIGMKGKLSGKFTGPFTFGEIAYVLVNQTMVVLSIHE